MQEFFQSWHSSTPTCHESPLHFIKCPYSALKICIRRRYCMLDDRVEPSGSISISHKFTKVIHIMLL